MKKIPVHAKVHAWGDGFNDSFDVFVRRNRMLYDIFFSLPGYEEEQRIACITKREIFQEIMEALAYGYRGSCLEQINITWDWEEES